MSQDVIRDRAMGVADTSDLAHVRRQRDSYQEAMRFQSDRAYKCNMRALDAERERDLLLWLHAESEWELAERSRQLADLERPTSSIGIDPMEEVGQPPLVKEFPRCERGDTAIEWTPAVGERVTGEVVDHRHGERTGPYHGAHSYSRGGRGAVKVGDEENPDDADWIIYRDTLRPAPSPNPRQWVKGDPQPDGVWTVIDADGRLWTHAGPGVIGGPTWWNSGHEWEYWAGLRFPLTDGGDA